MPDIPDIEPDIGGDPDFKADGEAVEKTIDDANDWVEKNAKSASQSAFDQGFSDQVKKVNSATVKALKTVAEKSGIDLSNGDIADIQDFFDETTSIKDLSPETVSDLMKEQFKLSDRAQQFLDKYSDFCQDLFSKKLQAIDTWKETYNANKGAWKTLKDGFKSARDYFKKNPSDPNASKAVADKLSEMKNEVEKTSKDIEKKEPGLKDKLGPILYTLMIIGAMFGSIYALLAIFANGLSGCYVYYKIGSGDLKSTKLEGCSDWYNKDTNRQYCSCYGSGGNDVKPGTIFDKSICKDSDDVNCPYPYCIGKNQCKTDQLICTYPGDIGRTLQCTDVGPDENGYVYYGFELYTASTLLSKGIAAIANDFQGIFDALTGFLKNLPKYLLIGAGVFFLMFILYIIFKKISNSGGSSGHEEIVVVNSGSSKRSKR